MYRTSDTSLRVVIESGQNEWQYPLNNNARIEIPGKIGVTVIEIQDGSVRIAESPCPNHTCVARGAVHTAGIPLVCLPNAVCVTIRGGASPEDELDAIGH